MAVLFAEQWRMLNQKLYMGLFGAIVAWLEQSWRGGKLNNYGAVG